MPTYIRNYDARRVIYCFILYQFRINVSEPDGRHDCVSIFIIFYIMYTIICFIDFIIGPRHVFMPHPRYENVAILPRPLWTSLAAFGWRMNK